MRTVHRAALDDDAPTRTVPVRTCVGCRERDARTALVRVVAEQGHLVPDPRGRKPGRGAWLHPDPECLEQAERRRAIGRALRLQGLVDLTEVRRFLDEAAARVAEQAPEQHQQATGTRPSRSEAGRDGMSTR